MISIIEAIENRADDRAACRGLADELMRLVVVRLDKAPKGIQPKAVQMFINDLEAALRVVQAQAKASGVKP